MYLVPNENAENLSCLIGEQQKYIYEDVEMEFTRFAMPWKVTQSELIKRENDIFSGDIPYNETVSSKLF